jgi:hypothetical protein
MMVRWVAIVWYRSENGLISVEHFLEELWEIDVLVERGPHWDTIADICIRRVNHDDNAVLTIEKAERL